MSVAKSYVNYPIVDEPYEKNKRLYVHIKYSCCQKKSCKKCGGSGNYLKEIRWYDDGKALVKSSFNARGAFGFGDEGYITLLKGPQSLLDNYFRNIAPRQARYNLLFFWYVPSRLPTPKLPAGVETIRLNWEEISDSKGEIKDYDTVRDTVNLRLGASNSSSFVGIIGERIVKDFVVTNVSEETNHYGISKIYTMEDEESNCYLWKTASKELELNEIYHLSGTVKEYKAINNTNYTILTRCKEAAK